MRARTPQFAMGWWLLIDANVLSVQNAGAEGGGFDGVILWWFYVPGVISTVALIMYAPASAGARWDSRVRPV